MEREGERKGEKHQCVVASHTPPTGHLACNPGMCPDWESNWRPFGSQACTQSTEPYQLGGSYLFAKGRNFRGGFRGGSRYRSHQLYADVPKETYSLDFIHPWVRLAQMTLHWMCYVPE